ncbi:MBL fold metallo-hydrolase [Arenivirga flava]|uniref:Metallo-beta-lactamase domain-containing protein n=1 Tax=Arenivirga flava TaxID=1930060 RepID=A0AA37UT26_9MICO|nr:MBL fold metallo-hydrolase [Arenivirga flava]GMA27787.1 hypothetical protein GCM10025874_10400 [Arenivirga flava]
MPELHYHRCGETSHDVGALLRGAPRERRVFPAGVFRYDDGERRVLVDTGYAGRSWGTGASGWAYRLLLPPRVRPGETIAEQVDPSTVTHVVLTHLHPDHLGGVRDLPHATFVLSAGLVETLRAPRLREGVLPGLLPPWFDSAPRIVVDRFDDEHHGLATHDLFGDGSLCLVDLPGHARGHVGVLVQGGCCSPATRPGAAICSARSSGCAPCPAPSATTTPPRPARPSDCSPRRPPGCGCASPTIRTPRGWTCCGPTEDRAGLRRRALAAALP